MESSVSSSERKGEETCVAWLTERFAESSRARCAFLSKAMVAIAVAWIVILYSIPALGQVARGNITGTVSDASGARIPGVVVTIVQSQTGLSRTVKTNSDGEFSATLLPIGTYSVTFEHSGFGRKVWSGIELHVDQTVTLNEVLEAGKVTQTTTVTGQAPLLQAATSSLGQIVGNRYMVDLPLNGRNPYNLGLLSGNAAPMVGTGGTNQPFVAGGARYTANQFLVDGVTNTDFQHNIVYVPSVDAVQEYKVQTSTYSAEFGNAAGAVVNLVTKAGTNHFHGNVYEYLRNDKLDANDFFSNAEGVRRPPFKRNQYGFSVGGPLGLHPFSGEHNTFFFFNWEQQRQRSAAFGGLGDVPPLAFRQGDFSQLKDAKGNLIPIYDPATRRVLPDGTITADPFPGNIIRSDRLNPVALKVLALVPKPNVGSPDAQARNFFRTAPHAFDTSNIDVRVDHTFSPASTIFIRGSRENGSSTNPGLLPPPLSGSTTVSRPKSAVLNFTRIFGPSIVNEAEFSAVRSKSASIGASQGVIIPGLAHFPFPVQGLPEIAFNFSGNRSGPQQFNPWGGAGSNIDVQNTFEWRDNLTFVKGKHTIKTGMEIYRLRDDFIGGDVFFGRLFLGSIFTANPQVPNSGSPFAEFLLGYPSFEEGGQMLNWGRLRQIYDGEYVEDDWKILPRLTLNLGLRYDLWSVPVDAQNVGGFLDVSTGHIALPGQGGYSRGIVDGDHNNFAPRFGFAYQVNPRLVVRGGYGIFYAQQEKNLSSTRLAANPPNTPVFSIPTVDPARTVAPPFDISTNPQLEPFQTNLNTFSAQNPVSRTFFTPDFHNQAAQYLQQYNLTLQYKLAMNWLLELAYSGSLGRKLGSRVNLNQLPEQSVFNGTNTQANRFAPYVNGILVYDGAFGTSNYNALNVKVEKRFSRSFQMIANYTYSRDLELGPPGVEATFDQNGGTSLPLDSFHMERDYGPSVLDFPHRFVASGIYQLPFGPGQHFLNPRSWLGNVVGGWQVNTILTWQSGFPTDIRYGKGVPNFSTANVPDRVPGASLEVSNPSVDQFFNSAAFLPAPVLISSNGTKVQLYGNLALRVARGPERFDTDFSLFKNFLIGEKARLQFRAEFFNLTNTPTFNLPSASSPNLTFGSTTFGKLSSASSVGRQIQLALRLEF